MKANELLLAATDRVADIPEDVHDDPAEVAHVAASVLESMARSGDDDIESWTKLLALVAAAGQGMTLGTPEPDTL